MTYPMLCSSCGTPLDMGASHLQEILNHQPQTVIDLMALGCRLVGTLDDLPVYGYRHAYFKVQEGPSKTIGGIIAVNPASVYALIPTRGGGRILDKTLFAEFKSICFGLSPEWLHEDGEASDEEVREKMADYKVRWAAAEARLGMPIAPPDFEALVQPVYDWRNLHLEMNP